MTVLTPSSENTSLMCGRAAMTVTVTAVLVTRTRSLRVGTPCQVLTTADNERGMMGADATLDLATGYASLI